MLFDLRSPHRRRVIKVVYVFLAVLIGGGLIFFGIGNGSNFGGLLTAAGNGGGSGSTSGQKQYINALAKAEKLAKASPQNAALWLKAGEAAYSVATLPTNYDSSTGYTVAGHVALNKLRQAWQNYLAAAPSNPSGFFAGQVVAGFSTPPTGVGDYTTAESAQEVVAAAQPTDVNYEYLAYYAWLAKDISTGDLAAARARTLAPKKDLATVNTTLSEMESVAGVTGPTGATGASGSAGATGATGSTSG